MRIQQTVFTAVLMLSCALAAAAQNKPKLTLDEFFNSVGINGVEISPDGNSVVFAAERADWDQQIFRSDLWLYRDDAKGGSLVRLTQSGHDSEPKWSPDGRWIAFVSERKSSSEKSGDSDSDSGSKDEASSQIYLISPNGGEAFAITEGEEDVHAFSWSVDSKTIFFATRQPWTGEQKDEYKKEWKDVVQYRTAERGDLIVALNVAAALERHAAAPAKTDTKTDEEKKKTEDLTPGARRVAATPLRVDHLEPSPDGTKLAFLSNAINQRQEKYEDVEIYTVDIAGSETKLATPRRITHNTAVELRPHWASDSRHILFQVEIGDVSGPYRDLQPHLYSIDTEKPDSVEQWSKNFIGPVDHFTVAGNTILAAARIGTEVQMYSAAKPADEFHQISKWPGTYSSISVAKNSSKVAFLHSALDKPEELYVADSLDKLNDARPITSLQQALHRARSAARQALPVEGRRRHDGGRHADLPSRKI